MKLIGMILAFCLLLFLCLLIPFGLEPKAVPAEFAEEPLEFRMSELEALDGTAAMDFCIDGDRLIYLDRWQDDEKNMWVSLKQYRFEEKAVTELTRMEDVTGKYSSLHTSGGGICFVRAVYMNPPGLDLKYSLVQYNLKSGKLAEYEGDFVERLYRVSGDFAWYWTYVGEHTMGLECRNLQTGEVTSIAKKAADRSFSQDRNLMVCYDLKQRTIKRYDTKNPHEAPDNVFCRDKRVELAVNSSWTVWRSRGRLCAYNHETEDCITFTPQNLPAEGYDMFFCGELLFLMYEDAEGHHARIYDLEGRTCQAGTLPKMAEFTQLEFNEEHIVAYDTGENRFLELRWEP